LCEQDGDRFLADFPEAKRPLVIAACAPNMQYKIFRDAFAEKGMDVKRDMTPLDIRDVSTDAAIEKVATALREMGVKRRCLKQPSWECPGTRYRGPDHRLREVQLLHGV
jgi:heterodisulfide reductase subunit A-like polyferredoxin